MRLKSVITLILFLNFSLSVKAIDFKDSSDTYNELRTQIVIYNLINGLYLDKEQIEFILEKAKEAKRLKEELKQRTKEIASNQTSYLLSLKENVKNDQTYNIPEEVAKNIHQANYLIKKL
jgi:hypothetical protein